MSYSGGRGRQGGGRFGSGGGRRGGGRSGNRGGRGGGGGGRGYNNGIGSEICRRFVDGSCDFGQPNGRPCHYPHFVKKIGETRGHAGAIKDVVIWSARQQLFTCSADATLKLWDCAAWTEMTTINVLDQPASGSTSGIGMGHSNPRQKDKGEGVACMVLEGPFLFAGFDTSFPFNPQVQVGMIRGWNLENPQAAPYEFRLSETVPFAHSTTVLSLAVATDPAGGATLFSGSTDGTIRYWQLDATTNEFKCRGTLDGHVRGVTRLKTFMMGTAPILASASIDSTIRLWDLTTFQCVKTLANEDNGQAFQGGKASGEGSGHTDAVMDLEFWVNQGETFLISGGLDCQVIVWSLSPPFQQVYKEVEDSQVTALCGAQDASQQPILMIGAADGSITIKELPAFAYKTTLLGGVNHGHQDAVRRLTIGPHNTFFSASNDKKMFAWQITGEVAAIKSD